MLTTADYLIRHACDISALLDAVLLSKKVLVIHCRGHQKGDDKTAKGNKAANEVAKWAVMQEYIASLLLWKGTLLPPQRPQYRSEESKQASDKGYQLDHWG
jgi:hypothetical protein